MDDYEALVEKAARIWIRSPVGTPLWKIIADLRRKATARPPRRMPTIAKIAAHHGKPADQCWKCGDSGPLERAHVVDRMEWDDGAGLDGPQNLALLCSPCHRFMPIVRPAEWEQGLEYVGLRGPTRSPVYEIARAIVEEHAG